ncbi:MAG: hypothetical protein J0I67_01495 [Bosea sp.]|nr:hypothetical protein [Bosea sp. (in: a-proteobacteria)]
MSSITGADAYLFTQTVLPDSALSSAFAFAAHASTTPVAMEHAIRIFISVPLARRSLPISRYNYENEFSFTFCQSGSMFF